MPLLARTVPAPVAIDIRRGAIGGLATLLADGRISSGGDVAIAVGSGIGEEIVEHLKGPFPTAEVFKVAGGSMEAARELIEHLRGRYHDAVVGIGGGGTLDVAKYAAGSLGLPFVSVSTTLTHDGLASPVAVLEAGNRKGSYGVPIPIAVVVDLDFVARSPARHTQAGIGDVVSNLCAIADWELAATVRSEPVDGLAAALARQSAEAIVRQTAPIDDPGFLTVLAEALVLSGIAMSVAGSSRPCSGADHEISHAIDALYPGTGFHGEQVAVGTLFATFLRGGSLDTIDACFRRYGLPRRPMDLGLSPEAFTSAVMEAPSTRPDRFTILEHLALDESQVRTKVDEFIQTLAG